MTDLSTLFSLPELKTLTLQLLLKGLLLLLAGLVLVRILLRVFDRVIARSKTLAPLSVYLRTTLKVLLYALLLIIVLGSLGVEVTSFVALLSVAGLAVSLALQTSLSNVAGGITLLLSKPFTIGDYISADGIEGTVTLIGLSFCTLTTIDNKEVFVPCSQLSAARITNYNRLGRRRVDLTFSASYDAPTQTVKDALREAMAAFPQILPDPEPDIFLSEYGASSISYLARMWVRAEDYWAVYYGMLERVRDAFAAHGVEMTYDHLNVHMVQD